MCVESQQEGGGVAGVTGPAEETTGGRVGVLEEGTTK